MGLTCSQMHPYWPVSRPSKQSRDSRPCKTGQNTQSGHQVISIGPFLGCWTNYCSYRFLLRLWLDISIEKFKPRQSVTSPLQPLSSQLSTNLLDVSPPRIISKTRTIQPTRWSVRWSASYIRAWLASAWSIEFIQPISSSRHRWRSLSSRSMV